ncbi:hypothetical protein ABB02_00343 [Clostridiaceae bacterium JG1575]|nr:hypothetical protein ABB02_00343 [Clostridiaceae bacterium JG1575]
MVEHVTDANFAKVVEENEQLVIADFWASWCGPCKMMGPIFEEAAKEVEGVTFAKINVDENPSSAAKYRVGSIPTILAIKGGKVVGTMVGFKPKAELLSFVASHR